MDQTTVQLGRWLSVGIAAALGGVILDMRLRTGYLKDYLAMEVFGTVVLVAMILLVAMVALKVLGMLQPNLAAHECSHEGHSHDHGVSLWRLAILVMPLMILMSGMVPRRLSAEAMQRRLSSSQLKALEMQVGALPPERQKSLANAQIMRTTLKELIEGSRNPTSRELWESTKDPKVVQVIGEFSPMAKFPDRYQLMRQNMTCCSADTVPVVVPVIGTPGLGDLPMGAWIEITAAVTYQADPSGKYTAVLHQISAKKSAQPADIYLR